MRPYGPGDAKESPESTTSAVWRPGSAKCQSTYGKPMGRSATPSRACFCPVGRKACIL